MTGSRARARKEKQDGLVRVCKNKIKRFATKWGKWWDLFIPKMEIAAAV